MMCKLMTTKLHGAAVYLAEALAYCCYSNNTEIHLDEETGVYKILIPMHEYEEHGPRLKDFCIAVVGAYETGWNAAL